MTFQTNTKKIITTGDGVRHTQNRFFCPVHGSINLFVFPDAEARHARCGDRSQKSNGIGLELPKAMKKAA